MSDEAKEVVQSVEKNTIEQPGSKTVAEETAVSEAEKIQAEEKLEKATEERLEKTFSGESPVDLAELPDNQEDSTPKSEDEKSAEKPDEEDDSTPGEKDEKPEAEEKDEKVVAKDEDADKGETKEDAPQLPDAYYRAAIHREWKPEDIDELYKANPKLCIKTLANIYEEVNRASRDFAAIGRAHKLQEQQQQQGQEQGEQKSSEKVEFKTVDADKLRKDYPDDPIAELVIEQNQQNKILFDEVQTLKQTRPAQQIVQPSGVVDQQQRAIDQEENAIRQQIETFFESDELNDYSEFYGDVPKNAVNWDNLIVGQRANRWAVIQMMDEMMVGAELHGRELKVDEAMRLAHLSVTEPIREKVIRKNIQDSVTKRSKGLSLKPSSSAKVDSTKPQTKEELESVTEERLRKVFG